MKNCVLLLFALCLVIPPPSFAQLDETNRKLARDILQELIEINTTDSVGNVTTAAEAMAKRLRDAGFADSDIFIGGPNDRKKNLVVRLRGTGAKKPVLLIGHLDVVEAHREDWTSDPFQLVEKDGYFYGRGTEDMKASDASVCDQHDAAKAGRLQARSRHHSGVDGRRRRRQVEWS